MSPSRTARGLLIAALLAPSALAAQEAIPMVDLERAMLPLPVSDRAGATVMVVENDVARVVKEGDGQFICLADTPGDERFQAACYHRTLEPYMARGRELRKEGLTSRESIAKRQEEIEAGELEMPAHGMLHQVFAEGDWDGDMATASRLTVIYVPFATAEELGLPDGRAEGPWVMFSGSPTAHIMIGS
ncbi:MAG: hypothetical protein R3195_19725 [Gemmatimonadota bacterium]|nr:hypothetical protein [Gemmatimonadota bacterium]